MVKLLQSTKDYCTVFFYPLRKYFATFSAIDKAARLRDPQVLQRKKTFGAEARNSNVVSLTAGRLRRVAFESTSDPRQIGSQANGFHVCGNSARLRQCPDEAVTELGQTVYETCKSHVLPNRSLVRPIFPASEYSPAKGKCAAVAAIRLRKTNVR